MATVAQEIRILIDNADSNDDDIFFRYIQLQHRAAIVVQGDYDRTTYVYADDSIIHTGYDHMGWSGVAIYNNIDELTKATGITLRSTTK